MTSIVSMCLSKCPIMNTIERSCTAVTMVHEDVMNGRRYSDVDNLAITSDPLDSYVAMLG